MCVMHSDECYLCDFTNGQIWLRDHNNCHMFFVCEPIGYLQYRKHHMTCGDLWWQQDIHTCVTRAPDGCDMTVPIVTYPSPSTSEGENIFKCETSVKMYILSATNIYIRDSYYIIVNK